MIDRKNTGPGKINLREVKGDPLVSFNKKHFSTHITSFSVSDREMGAPKHTKGKPAPGQYNYEDSEVKVKR
jgi:hypothetical protein